MKYQIVPFTKEDKKRIYCLTLFATLPGFVSLLGFGVYALFENSLKIFTIGWSIILLGFFFPQLFLIKYFIALKSNIKYVVKGVLTYKYSAVNGHRDSIYEINNEYRFLSSSFGEIFCDRVYEGNSVEIHFFPFMLKNKRFFFVKRIDETYNL